MYFCLFPMIRKYSSFHHVINNITYIESEIYGLQSFKSLLEILSSPQLTEDLRLEIRLTMYPTFTGRKQINRFYLKNPLVEKQYQKYKMPVGYLANKVVIHLFSYILLLYKIFALINEFICNCHFRLAT